MLHWRKDCVRKYLLIEEDAAVRNQNCFYYTSINYDKIADDDGACMCVCVRVLLRVSKEKYYRTQRRKHSYNIIPAAFKASFTHCGISPFSF